MAQKPLVDAEELRISLGLMAHEDVTATLERAIVSSQIYFEEVLQTRLMKQSSVDHFNIDPQVIYVVPDNFYRLRLRYSLVRDDPALVVTKYESYPALMGNLGGVILSKTAGDYFVNKDKGVVHINADNLSVVNQDMVYGHRPARSYFVKVAYDAGIASKADAPEWLKEAVGAFVPGLVQQKQLTNRSDNAEKVYEQGKKYAFTLLEPYMRDVGFCFRAL